jgi:glycosyltransferase involved in cell wall biosynthesis
MKIVWVSHDHGLSAGAELCLWEGVKGLVDENHDVHVIVPAEGKLAELLKANHIPVSILDYQWWVHSSFRLPVPRLWRNLRAATKLAEILRRIQPDVVISNTLTIPTGAFAARKACIPHVWYIHEFGMEDHGLKFDLGSAVSLTCIRRLSARVIVNSRAVRDRFAHAIPEAKLRVLYYAVDVPARTSIPDMPADPFRLILVGRICPGKRQEDAIRALGWLSGKGVNPRLSLVGSENLAYGRLLRGMAQELDVANQIEFLPFTADPFSLVARCHVALVCSKSEAFGRVTIEAMKQGKPVIGANTGATVELIQDGSTGLLYRAGDPEDLGRKVLALGENRPLLQAMGANAREWSWRTFNRKNHVSALIAILQEAAADLPKR